ncbi:MAG: hypothetical protein K6G01_04670 [Eubacterium sp.]|nr:hypothetical protein [Eubacterium sp.]
MEDAVLAVTQAIAPRLVYRVVSLQDGKSDAFTLQGEDIARTLKGCKEAVFFAATLGSRAEQLLMKAEVQNLADAVIMDAIESVAIENVCNNFEQDYRAFLGISGLYLTSRYSPGYGDLPLEVQGQWCAALNAEKRIGLSVTDNHLMIPRKSVTAVMGIADTPRQLRENGCAECKMFRNCEYRKDGRDCRE